MKRSRVFVQIRNQATNRWHNYKSAKTYEEAIVIMNALKAEYPEAITRILDNNLATYTK